MSWFWKSKTNQKQVEEAALKAQEELDALHTEIQRLQSSLAESERLQAEWQASLEMATQERDALRAVSENALAHERQQAAEKHAQLEQRHQELESNLAEANQKHHLLDAANVEMAEMLKSSERRFEELQTTSSQERSERDETIRQRDQRLADLQSELTARQSELTAQQAQHEQAVSHIANLTRQLTDANEQAVAKQADLEQRLTAEAENAAARIEQLEQQLAQSELKSANRAEQRSALLRNMAEIHRLSATSSKSEPSPDSLKVVSPEWSGQADAPAETAGDDTSPSNSFLSRSGT
ncbi:hypothetical protein [Schlesneria paludicola]|uniref:hypothetical protein n=1 Tax=Schlesneria paludicola TaxID=360056 RepID=UPI0012FAE853|nr:hypothetical protein [Schlesneria paludicola]